MRNPRDEIRALMPLLVQGLELDDEIGRSDVPP